MLVAEKRVNDYEQIPVDVLKGEPKSGEHLTRHPFGKVPVVEIDGFRVIETPAIPRYLDALLPAPSLTPDDLRDRARMDMITSIIDSYGYSPLVGGVAAYHLFPDFVGGRNHAVHHEALGKGRLVISAIMRIGGQSPYLAGDEVSIADIYLAPIFAYVTLTPHKDEFLAVAGVGDWWERIRSRPSFEATQP